VIQFIPMDTNDIDRIMQFDQASLVQWPRQYYFKIAYSKNYYGILAQIENQCIGNIMFRIHNRYLHIDKIIVTKIYRNQGIGGKLLKTAIDVGKIKKMEIALLTVFYNNNAAMDFYAKHGFTIESIKWNHYHDGVHGVKMYRTLSQNI